MSDLASTSAAVPVPRPRSAGDSRRLGSPISAGVLCWLLISAGFVGLKFLMQHRPQFVGQPVAMTKAVLVQESPQIVARRVTDDVSAIKPLQPESIDVRFEMNGRRDYRGLRTISDMSGRFRATHVLANDSDDPLFVLFKCAHPRAEARGGEGVLASALRLQSSVPGAQENIADAWLWSGTIPPRAQVTLEIGYDVGSLRGVTYRIREQQGNPLKHVRVAFARGDLDAVRIESGDGANVKGEATLVWERRDFLPPDFFAAHLVEGRNLFTSLWQLLEIGPVVSLLFLLALLAAILARQPLTALQVLTLGAGYALYFPLILYLSSRFSFAVAMVAAVLIPGILLVNYARWLVGARAGLIGGLVFLGLYQVFPTLAAFGGWNRGMVLLALGVVTLAVLIQLQNQSLRRGLAVAAALMLTGLSSLAPRARAADVQVLVPANLAELMREPKPALVPALVAYEAAEYSIQHEPTHLRVTVKLPLQVLRPSAHPVALFAAAVHLGTNRIEGATPDFARLATVANRLNLFAEKPGSGALQLGYRVPIVNREGKKRAQIPLLSGPSGNVRLESPRSDLEILTGSVWTKTARDAAHTYEIGVAGEESLVVEWQERSDAAATAGAKEFYGIGVTRAQHLTVIHSDGSCSHFAEIDVPPAPAQDFRLALPAGVRLVSASLNGTEIASPVLEGQSFQLRLPNREAMQSAHRLSFRLAYPAQRLGFVGVAQLTLPELTHTVGTLEWVVALPAGFQADVISSGLETQTAAPDLSRFGDYGRIVQSQPHTALTKHLAPPAPVNLQLKYRQLVAGFFGGQ